MGQLSQRGGWCFKLVLLAHSVRNHNVRSRAHEARGGRIEQGAHLFLVLPHLRRGEIGHCAKACGGCGAWSQEVKELVMSAEMECPIFAPRFETKVALWSSVAYIRLSLLMRERLTETFTAEN